MLTNTRVRFAPSPTGPLHIGGVRTALFNYLFAKKNNGTFILRIEDTDQNRYVDGAEDYIVESLNWLNIPFDEGPGIGGDLGPYRQSERKEIYTNNIQQLIDSGNAYYAFDTPEKLDFHRKDHEEKGKTFIYNWHNRLKLDNSLSLDAEELQQRINSGEPYVIRFKSPENETLELNDIIRGEITIDTNILDDKILFKSDGMPTYHLANIVDDHLMKITHVIRGEEWLPSLALHVLLYRAFGWDAPQFAHLPLILKPEGKGKLSKRDGDKMGFPVFPLQWEDPHTGDVSRGYREDGYFPEAVVNMLALLGWNEGDGTEKEIYSLAELIQAFSLDHVSKSGAKFNPDKTKWFNQQYLQQKSDDELARLFVPIIANEMKQSANNEKILRYAQNDNAYVSKVVSLIKERATFVSDLWELGSYFFIAPLEYDEKAAKKVFKDDSASLLEELSNVIERIPDFSSDKVSETVKAWITEKAIGFGKVMMPLRLSLVGSLQGPDVFEIAALLGKEETLQRIKRAIEKLG